MIQNNYTVSETVSRMAGRHNLKVGIEKRRENFNVLQQSNAGGQISFAGSATSVNSTGYAFADLLIGVPSSSQQVPRSKPNTLYWSFAPSTVDCARSIPVQKGTKTPISCTMTRSLVRSASHRPTTSISSCPHLLFIASASPALFTSH